MRRKRGDAADDLMPLRPLRRIMIIGGAGAGKSTLARSLGDATGLCVHHLDALFWQPGWVEPDREVFHRDAAVLAAGGDWIIEGNYSATWPLRAERADLIVFLDVPAALRLVRVGQRRIRHAGGARPDMAPGCPERVNAAFVRWVLTYRWHGRPKALALIRDARFREKSVHLRSMGVRDVVRRLTAENGVSSPPG